MRMMMTMMGLGMMMIIMIMMMMTMMLMMMMMSHYKDQIEETDHGQWVSRHYLGCVMTTTTYH